MNKKQYQNKFISKAVKGFLCAVLVALFLLQSAVHPAPVKAANDGFNYRVGLVYGKNVKKALEIKSTDTYTLGFQSLTDSSKSFTSFGTLPGGTVYVALDGYLSSGAKNGGYSWQTATKYTSYSAAYSVVESIKKSVSGLSVFVTYQSGDYRVRIGNFYSTSEADSYLSYLKTNLGSSYSFERITPSTTQIAIINSSGYVVFKFESGSYTLGLKAKSGYLTYNSKTYEGVMSFKRYTTSSADGVQLVSVLPLERYVMCVVPNEIMVSWPEQTLKAFAITVRSYAVSGRNYYNSSYGFDITGTSQVYGMASNVDSKTEKAVRDTEGIVMAYNGKVAEAYYSSSVGGVTVGSGDAYVTSYPYLVAVNTPWEKYSSLSSGYHGVWTLEMSGEKLLSNIKAYGYANLKGSSITSLTVNSYGENSTYVKSVTVKDNLGNTATINGSDNVRIRLGLYSANFVVGKGSVTYTYDTVTTHSANAYDGNYPAFNLTDFNVITSAGQFLSRFTKNLKIRTANGDVTNSSPKANVVTGKGTSNGHVVYTTASTTKTASGSSSNFIFAGKGWGHGVGLSQFGIRDLGNMGYTYDEMLRSYYTNIEIVHYATLGIS